MKVEWLNGTYTEARLSRGFLWWKRVALVSRKTEGKVSDDSRHTYNWLYVEPNVWCERELDQELDNRRYKARTWRKPAELPSARLLP